MQTNAGASYVTDNVFETPFSTGVAYMAYADTTNTTRGSTAYILQRLYHFKRNTVKGGSVGVKFAGNSYPRGETANLAPQLTGFVEDNTRIELNPADKIVPTSPPTGILAAAMQSVTVHNNQFYNCSRMFQTGIEPQIQTEFVRTDFRSATVLIESNTLHAFGPIGGVGGSMESIFFQLPLRKDEVATIGKNTLARGANFPHILLGGTNTPKISKLNSSQGNHPPTPPVGQIEAGNTYKVYVPPNQTGAITYNGVNYSNGATFTGLSSPSYFQTTGAAQVRLATYAPLNYLVKIGTSPTNKNTYKLWTGSGSADDNPFNRFLYYNPNTNSVPNFMVQVPPAAPDVEAKPEYSPKDGVSVQNY